ncbi:MAG TPA: PAS domain S-box protein [Gemmatimonadales bacterium]|nr:PAS domain S-box protein [Gemmatimonadales bacterium]
MTHSLLLRPDRLAALRQTALLDTPPEEGFDRLTRMAARLLGAPTSLISLVTDERQFFKSTIGLPEPWATRRSAPLSFSFCSTVAGTGEPLVVEDARRHPLLRHSQALRELGWVSYAGVPLISRDGQVLGSFCVVDRMPRLWSERDIALLQDLAASVVTEIELRREIARREQAELGRRDNEEELYSTFEQAGIGMALITLEGRWLRVNRALSELLGAPPEDLLGFPAEARTHPEDVAADQEAIQLLLAGEARSYTIEKRFVKSSGEMVWGLVNVSLVAGAEGQPSHLIAAIQDITERKQAEASLGAREEGYRLVLQESGRAIREWDLTSDRMTWDPGVAPPLDYGWSDVGETADWWYQRVHPDDRERVVQSFDVSIANQETTWTGEYRFRRADGSYAVVQDRASIIRDETGRPIRVVAAMADLSRISHGERVEQLLNALPFALWLLDRQGRVVLANAASTTVWGFTPENLDQLAQLPASNLSTGEPLQPTDWDVVRTLERGEASAGQEIIVEVPGGIQRTLRLSSFPLDDPGGERTGAVLLAEDITEQKSREATDRERAEQLQQGQRLEAVGRLAGGIAHDFNNLLTGILSYSDLILQELRPGDPLRNDVEQIRDAGQRAAGLTRQLLAFSRRQLLRPRVVSLNAAVNELAPMLQRLLGPEIRLETELEPELGNVFVDPAQVEQALVNLTLNARDAMTTGGELRISTANTELEGEPYVSLRVSDTGMGIDPEIQPRIFEPFFTTKQGGGRGLGLSTVYGIMVQSGGRVMVDSAPGRGATFTLQFPRHFGAETPVGAAEQRMPEVGTETVLLVEDEAAVRASLRRLLELHGYTVLEARNGAEALKIYEAHEGRVDLVLTDVVMPEMGGLELVDQLRSARPDLKVLIMSGYAERALTSNGSIPKGTGYLEKPFTAEVLMRRLREVLEGRREQ